MTERRRLIVSADDFGLSAGTNAGIVRAHRDGILTNASLMVTGRGFDEAVELARATPKLGVGLHLVLVQGYPASPPEKIPLLIGADGSFGHNAIACGIQYFFRPGIRDQLRREIEAQLDRYQATGLPLSHVDGHLNIHMHPAVLAILIELAPSRGIRAIRLPREPLGAALRFERRHLRRKLFEGIAFGGLSRFAAPRLKSAALRHPDQMFGLHQTGRVSEEYLLHLLRRLPAGVSELYCHAGYPDAESARWRPADYDPEQELAALTSARVRAVLESERIALTSYGLWLQSEA